MTGKPTATDRLCRKPSGFLGRLSLRNMNKRHSPLTDWGLSHMAVPPNWTILDIGCGGGRTLEKLAAATKGEVCGVDHSPDSVAASTNRNAQAVADGRVRIVQGSVSALPFPDNAFDLVTAVETHFFWPNLPGDVREVLRVLRPGGAFLVIAEIYKGANTAAAKLIEKRGPASEMKLLTPDEHRDLLESAGYANVQVALEETRGWISCRGTKAQP
ncbi:MAG TPA: class I SAM-dependent methyltransferase [Acidobacteriaceae bacterium]